MLDFAIEILSDEMEGMDFEDKANYLNDVCMNGCVSGCVGSVIYYHQTEHLFKENMEEIMVYLQDNEIEIPMEEYDRIWNWAVWVVVEAAAHYLIDSYEEGFQELEEDKMAETTDELLERSEDVLDSAKNIDSKFLHGLVWDRKVVLWNRINEALEGGFYTGEAREELLQAKHNLLNAEVIAGQKARENYI